MMKNKTIIFTGSNGFPFGSASIQRQVQLAKSLSLSGFNVIVINRKGSGNKDIIKREKIKAFGVYQGIKYCYASFIPFRPTNYLSRNLLKLIGLINEVILVSYYVFFKNCKFIFNNSSDLKSLRYYYYLAKIFHIKLIYDYVEFRSSIGKREMLTINEVTANFDYEFPKYSDSIITISQYLENHIKQKFPKKKTIKIPPIIDFSFIENVTSIKNKKPSFLFCGSAGYDDIIRFIIDSFLLSKAEKLQYNLLLVINGDETQLRLLNDYINKIEKNETIKLYTKLKYEQLISMYKGAVGLLIPMTNSLQDRARFPFKISEYSASKRPIITSDSGPIREFFSDSTNALIADVNDVNSFASKLNILMENPKIADKIGEQGYLLGKEVFNYKTYSKNLFDFLNQHQ